MLLATDVHYKEKYAKVVGVLFNWEDEEMQGVWKWNVADVFAGNLGGTFDFFELKIYNTVTEFRWYLTDNLEKEGVESDWFFKVVKINSVKYNVIKSFVRIFLF